LFAVSVGGNLQLSPNPLAAFQWAAWREGKGNVERGGGKRKEKGKGRDGNRSGLSPSKKKS